MNLAEPINLVYVLAMRLALVSAGHRSLALRS